MTEIGLAQRRLVDDELPPTAPCVGSSVQDERGHMVEGENNGLDYGYNPVPHEAAPLLDANNLILQPGEIPEIQPIPPVDNANNSLSNYDYTQSNTSYNIFESLKQSTDNSTSATHIGNEQNTYKSPHRSKSMQVTPYSPHDTEPFSSMVSPKLSRSMTDNGPSSNSHLTRSTREEFQVPDVSEMPPAKKKRGRKRKQEDQGDDGVSKSHGSGGIEQNNEPKKRKPGRPPSNTKAQTISVGHQQEPSTDVEANETHSESNGVLVPVNCAPEVPVEGDEMQLVEVNIPKISTTHSPANDVSFAQPTKPAKEPRKKKLKRGKTTSVTLKKTYESDVEDDVIWIDEKPANFGSHQQPTEYRNHAEPSIISNCNKVETQNSEPAATVEETQSVKPANSVPSQTEPPPAGPKKRGRKRKKTSEQLAAESAMTEPNAAQETLQPDNPSTTIEPTVNNNPPNPIEYTDSGPSEKPQPNPPTPSPTKQPQPASPPPVPEPAREADAEADTAPTTPQKQTPAVTPNGTTKIGPDKHSPISGTSRVPYRVGLSRRARIAPLLKVVRR